MEKFDFEDLLYEDLVFTAFDASNMEDLICKLSRIIEKKGYVTADYAQDVIEREKKYPTALPTKVMQVAIPHAENSRNVITPSIVIAKLVRPILFMEMGSFDQQVEVDLVFLLAVKGSKTQLSLLPKLISIFSDQAEMDKLEKAQDGNEIIKIIKEAANK